MPEPVELSTLGEAQLQSWQAILDLYEVIDSDWTLIGGQLAHLHCAERNTAPVRPTAPRRHLGRLGTVLRPTLVGALVGKAAARTEISSDRKAGRHCIDFVILASLVIARDFRDAVLSKKDRSRLAKMIDYCRNDADAMSVPYAAEHLSRLERAIHLAG